MAAVGSYILQSLHTDCADLLPSVMLNPKWFFTLLLTCFGVMVICTAQFASLLICVKEESDSPVLQRTAGHTDGQRIFGTPLSGAHGTAVELIHCKF